MEDCYGCHFLIIIAISCKLFINNNKYNVVFVIVVVVDVDLRCSPKENSELFFSVPGSFGSIGCYCRCYHFVIVFIS